MRHLAAALTAALLPAMAEAQTGPHLSPQGYEAARGEFGPAAELAVSIERGPLEADLEAAGTIEVLVGEDWVLQSGSQALTLFDHAAKRTVEFDAEAGTYVNSATHAHARRNLDIFVQLSEGGQAEEIDFGAAGTFDRFWLEAAMGIAPGDPELDTAEEEGARLWRRAGETIARAEFGECYGATLDGAHTASLIAWLRRAAPIHPAIADDLAAADRAPCRLEFVIYSPDSPQGRREAWQVTGAGFDEAPVIFPEGAQPVLPAVPLLSDLAGPAALVAVRGETGPVPGPFDFLAFIEQAREARDLSGALLLTARETHHFGPCPDEAIGTARLACASLNDLARSGIGQPGFERVMTALNALPERDHATAVENLIPDLEREDRAGAAARTIVANELIAWGREGLEAHPDLDPARLLAEALALDPLAPDSYWHLARRYLAAGSPLAGWALLELGRALPEREMTPLLAQSVEMETRIEELAPGFFLERSGVYEP